MTLRPWLYIIRTSAFWLRLFSRNAPSVTMRFGMSCPHCGKMAVVYPGLDGVHRNFNFHTTICGIKHWLKGEDEC